MTSGRFGATCAALAGCVVSWTVPSSAKPPEAAPPALRPEPATGRAFVTHHEGTFGGRRMRYEARVEEMILRSRDGRPTASIISTSYLATGPRTGPRPVVFVFNGGPGSSSAWLHIGLMGPRRVAFRDELHPETAAPFGIRDNPDSPLDAADIVLFDPPNTGFSRILADGSDEAFLGAQPDAETTVLFITHWIAEHRRWNSPKFVMGESYGTIRAALVARLLAGGPATTGHLEATTLNGVILFGQALDITDRGAGRDLRYLETLPSIAAAAWYHGRIDRGADGVAGAVTRAREFVRTDYLPALFAGSTLDAGERSRLAAKMRKLIGIDAPYLLAHDLRLGANDAADRMLADRGLRLGVYDSRFTLPAKPSGDDPVADDPAMAQYVPGYMAVLNDYMRDELKVTLPQEYRGIEWSDVNDRWDWGQGPGKAPDRDYAIDLAVAMRRNPSLRLFVGCGYYDLATPLGSAEYTIGHAGIPPSATSFRYYESGHMAYVGEENRQRVASDLRSFLRGAGSFQGGASASRSVP